MHADYSMRHGREPGKKSYFVTCPNNYYSLENHKRSTTYLHYSNVETKLLSTTFYIYDSTNF